VVVSALLSLVFCGIIPDNVLVVYNQASSDGIEISNYYSQVYPGVHLLGLTGVTTSENTTVDDYLTTIRPQIVSALNPNISVIATTKGLPLRIYNNHSNPGDYTDPTGVLRHSYTWNLYSSLESELTRIDSFSMWQQIGDQWKYYNPPCLNPWWRPLTQNNSFDFPTYGIRLTSRLDGYTVSDIKNSINRAKLAWNIPNSSWMVLDDDPSAPATSRLIAECQGSVQLAGQVSVYDNTYANVTTAPGPVIGYVSNGQYGFRVPSGQPNWTNQLDFNIANGAFFSTYESYNGGVKP